MSRIVSQIFKVAGVPTDVTSAVLEDPTNTYGVKRNDTNQAVVAAGTAMSRVAVGTYQYTFNDIAGVAFTAFVKFTYGSSVYYIEADFPAEINATGMTVSYSSLKERVGRYLYGIRTSFSQEQLADIDDCIQDGLSRVYASHEWSFFKPVVDVTTTEPYSTGTITIASGVVTLTGGSFPSWAADGLLKVRDNYYSVISRNSSLSLTLNAPSLTVASASDYQLARSVIPMNAGFEAVANDSELTYYPSENSFYPPVKQRGDQAIRKLEQSHPQFDRPVYYSIRTEAFDSTVGSKKSLVFYPTPDQAYTMRVPMILRPVMLDNANQYPIGGEMLSQVILEACLASAEHNLEEREHIHEKRFLEMIALAIRNDQDRSSPTFLGPDLPVGERGMSGVFDYDYRFREQRIGRVTLNGNGL